VLQLRLYAFWALETPLGQEGRYFGPVVGILSTVHEKTGSANDGLATYFKIAIPHGFLVQTPKPSTVEKIVNVPSVDAELDLYVATSTERWHLDASRDDMFFHLCNKLRTQASSQTLGIDATTLRRA